MRRQIAAAETLRKRRGKRLHVVGEQPAGETVDDEQQAEKHDHDRQHRRIVELPDDDPLDGDAGDKGKRERDDECRPIGHAGLDQRQRDIGGEHRLLALREIDVVRRLKDHHQRERDAGIDAAIGEARTAADAETSPCPSVSEIGAAHRARRR